MGTFRLISLSLFLILNSATTVNAIEDGTHCNPASYYKYDECMSNGEIHHFRCEGEFDGTWVHNKDKDQFCYGTNSKCLCENEVWEEFWNHLCRCVDATPYPNFPSTGILKWKENVSFVMDEDSSRVRVRTEHEIHRNANGYYLRKYPDYNWKFADLPWKYRFEIYVPIKPGRFKKITGTLKHKICEVDFVQHGGSSFDTLWHQKDLHTLDEKIKKSDTVTSMRWRRHFDKDFSIEYIHSWLMDYDSEKKVAIPVFYYHYWEDWYYDAWKTIRRQFEYTEVSDNKVSFDIKDYCKNEV